MKTVQKIQEELENECYMKTAGYTTFAQVEPGGTQNGLGYNASGFDIVVLDNDGRTVAYRYSDDTINDDWTIGDLEDVADAVINMQEARILDALTDEMIDIWHDGTANGEFNDLIERFGAFQVWGSRTGNEPLTIEAAE